MIFILYIKTYSIPKFQSSNPFFIKFGLSYI